MTSSTQHTPEYKMGGPKGVAIFAVFFTSYTYFITIKCQTGQWDLAQFPWLPCHVASLLSWQTTLSVTSWFVLQCVLYVMPLGGALAPGVRLESGVQLQYRLNAFFVLCVNVVLLLVAVKCDVIDVTTISKNLLQILTSSVVMGVVLSLYLYVRGASAKQQDRNKHGNTGNLVYDWFMGRELNPRWGQLDHKYVMFRSGIIGWIILNFYNLTEFWQTHGRLNANLVLVCAIQLFYVADYFWLERGVIVSRDIVMEGFGYNIIIQFIMIPFCFCVQTRYILTQNYEQSTPILAGVALVYDGWRGATSSATYTNTNRETESAGYYIYRASNSEKNNFRKNPDDPKLAHLKTMKTQSGRRLLISGWWGMCRHPNYLGDLIMSFSYALATGLNHTIPYLGTLFLVLLLFDREKQDGAECRRKYGKDWDKYCAIVKYRIVPGVY